MEVQPTLSDRARRGALLNGFEDRFEIETLDYRDLAGRVGYSIFDTVVSNPPFHSLSTGRASPDAERAAAHHELHGDLGDLLGSARHGLTKEGRIVLIYPSDRWLELEQKLSQEGYHVENVRAVHPNTDGPASRILVSATLAPQSKRYTFEPLYLYDSDGSYTDEAERILTSKTR